MHCGACGRTIAGEEHWNRRYGIRYVYYRCGRRRIPGSAPCTEPYVREPDVEQEIGETIAGLSVPEKLLT